MNNVVVLDNPSPFYNPFQFEITFECIEDLSEGEYRSPDAGSAAPSCRMRGPEGSPRPGPAPAAARLSSPQSRAATRGCGATAGPRGALPVRPLPLCPPTHTQSWQHGYHHSNKFLAT